MEAPTPTGDAVSPTPTDEGLSRRRFLKVMGVSTAGAAALSGCSTGKIEKLIPFSCEVFRPYIFGDTKRINPVESFR